MDHNGVAVHTVPSLSRGVDGLLQLRTRKSVTRDATKQAIQKSIVAFRVLVRVDEVACAVVLTHELCDHGARVGTRSRGGRATGHLYGCSTGFFFPWSLWYGSQGTVPKRVYQNTLRTSSQVCVRIETASPLSQCVHSLRTAAQTTIGNVHWRHEHEQHHLGPCETKDGKTKVEVYQDSTSTQRSNRLNKVALCRDAMVPMDTRFKLDTPRDDAKDQFRRGLGITVSDEMTLKAIRALDDTIVQAAVKNSKDWFKGKVLSEEQVRARYKPILGRLTESDTTEGIKVKVKCPKISGPPELYVSSSIPTTILLRDEAGKHRKLDLNVEDPVVYLTRGAKVVPIVSASYGIWFMGGGSQFGLSLQAEEMIVVPGETAGDHLLSHFASSAPLEMSETVGVKRPCDAAEGEPLQKSLRVELVEAGDGDGPM